MELFQAFLGTSAIIVMVKTFSRFPDTSFSVFTVVLASLAFTCSFVVELELVKLFYVLLGSVTLLFGFATLFTKR